MNTHFKQRLQERHELPINKHEFIILIKMCRNMINNQKCKRLSCSRSLVEIEYKGKNIKVIFNRSKNKIITVLPDKENVVIF